jgi:hypothetical protein
LFSSVELNIDTGATRIQCESRLKLLQRIFEITLATMFGIARQSVALPSERLIMRSTFANADTSQQPLLTTPQHA